ncbi:carboxymuconolactone decarboxylase family protein [Spirillospora sp. CA-294931]|uniref:carboxymuconolactone decarboxylase family protein n=1 Tax=Spirillospora sp. CA-294931 TaxID=3240042 RepID=UPI003D8AEF72
MIHSPSGADAPGGRAGRRLPPLHPGALSDEQREVYDAVLDGPRTAEAPPYRMTDADGRLLGPWNAMVHSPSVGMPLQELASALRFRTAFTRREREIAILVVARHCRSDFEWYAHERVGAEAGLTVKELGALRAGEAPLLADVRERVVHEAAREMAADGDLSDAVFTEAVAVLGRSCLVELVSLVGFYTALALQLRVFRMGVPGGEPAPEWGDDGPPGR